MLENLCFKRVRHDFSRNLDSLLEKPNWVDIAYKEYNLLNKTDFLFKDDWVNKVFNALLNLNIDSKRMISFMSKRRYYDFFNFISQVIEQEGFNDNQRLSDEKLLKSLRSLFFYYSDKLPEYFLWPAKSNDEYIKLHSRINSLDFTREECDSFNYLFSNVQVNYVATLAKQAIDDVKKFKGNSITYVQPLIDFVNRKLKSTGFKSLKDLENFDSYLSNFIYEPSFDFASEIASTYPKFVLTLRSLFDHKYNDVISRPLVPAFFVHRNVLCFNEGSIFINNPSSFIKRTIQFKEMSGIDANKGLETLLGHVVEHDIINGWNYKDTETLLRDKPDLKDIKNLDFNYYAKDNSMLFDSDFNFDFIKKNFTLRHDALVDYVGNNKFVKIDLLGVNKQYKFALIFEVGNFSDPKKKIIHDSDKIFKTAQFLNEYKYPLKNDLIFEAANAKYNNKYVSRILSKELIDGEMINLSDYLFIPGIFTTRLDLDSMKKVNTEYGLLSPLIITPVFFSKIISSLKEKYENYKNYYLKHNFKFSKLSQKNLDYYIK